MEEKRSNQVWCLKNNIQLPQIKMLFSKEKISTDFFKKSKNSKFLVKHQVLYIKLYKQK